MDEDDLDPSPEPKKSPALALGAAALVVLAGVVAWRFFGPSAAPLGPPDAGLAAAVEVAPPDAGPAPRLPLEDGDALLRRRGPELSSSKDFAAWLETPNVLRRIVAAVALIAEGRSPRAAMPFVSVPGRFLAREPLRSERVTLDPAGHRRYDAFARVVGSVSPTVAAKVYAELSPYLESAFAEIAAPGERFEALLGAAVWRVIAVEVPEGEVLLTPRGATYLFADPALERRPELDKHLVRMGPENTRIVQATLRGFADAVGLRPR